MTSTGRIRIGSAPDSWGVWFPDDPEQTPADRFFAGPISEAARAYLSGRLYF